MYLRKISPNFLRRMLRLPSQSFSSSSSSSPQATNSLPISLSYKIKYSYNYGIGGFCPRVSRGDPRLWRIIVAQAAIIFGLNSSPSMADASIESSSQNDTDIIGLRKVEDGSVISNIHTSKWRIFTDNGREYFLQGQLVEAERFFLSALEEAKEGFGKRDPHVASACNNLAELYRVMKAFDKAEPLYLEAINILEESFGPEDIRVGTALHNLGQFYLVQRKLEEAQKCYERALKIKGRVLGHGHADYADTMYHLGTVLYLQRKEKDAETLIQDSIRILEEGGQGESIMCIRRLRYLTQIYLKSNRLTEAENVQRKILHIMELTKGWASMETIIEAERLALTLQSVGTLNEAKELLERCLDARKTLLPEYHIQIGSNMLHLARVMMLNSNRLRKTHISEAISELDKAKDLLYSSARIAREVLNRLKKQKYGASKDTRREGRVALVILLQSLDALGLLEMAKAELQDSREEHLSSVDAENVLTQCISAYKEYEAERSVSDSPEVKGEYLLCLKHLLNLISDNAAIKEREKSRKANTQELHDEIKYVEAEISQFRKRKV